MRRQPSWRERWVGGCFSLLAGALALYWASRLIEAVWLVLVVVAVSVVVLGCLVAALRWRRQGW